jgi:hypothetical protein
MLYLSILILGAISSYFFSWWTVAPIIFLASYFKAKDVKQAATVGAMAWVTLWSVYALFMQYTSDVNVMDKIAGIFTGDSVLSKIPGTGFIIIVMNIISALLGGLAGTAGIKAKTFFS